jgi:DNA repair protein RadC
MIPPKLNSYEQSSSGDCRGSTQHLAISSEGPDAVRPKGCSNSVPVSTGRMSTIALRYDEATGKPRIPRFSVQSARLAARLVRQLMSHQQEELWVLALCPGKRLLGAELLFRGTVDACMAHPRDIFRYLCQHNASSFIVAHNHPSQDPSPSENDWLFTRQLTKAALLIGIPLLDHLVVTEKNHRSMASLRPDLFRSPNEQAPALNRDFS